MGWCRRLRRKSRHLPCTRAVLRSHSPARATQAGPARSPDSEWAHPTASLRGRSRVGRWTVLSRMRRVQKRRKTLLRVVVPRCSPSEVSEWSLTEQLELGNGPSRVLRSPRARVLLVARVHLHPNRFGCRRSTALGEVVDRHQRIRLGEVRRATTGRNLVRNHDEVLDSSGLAFEV